MALGSTDGPVFTAQARYLKDIPGKGLLVGDKPRLEEIHTGELCANIISRAHRVRLE